MSDENMTDENMTDENMTEENVTEMESEQQQFDEIGLEQSEELQADGVEASEGDAGEEALSVTEGSELDAFESAEIEIAEFLEEEQVVSILESLLFSTDRPQSLATLKQAFKGTSVKTQQVKRALETLAIEYAGASRGVTLEEVTGGYQLRTKVDNMNFIKRMVKTRSFRVSGPALEVLSIVAYKQPCIKSDVDEIRGVESGHLLRGLMDRGLISFAGKSELPGKPMLYATTKKFLEIFGLRNLKELPTLSQIDELIPEGIGDIEEKDPTLDQITDSMSKEAGQTYSEGEEELEHIMGQLDTITTTTDFFEEEKQRQKQKREAERAQDIRDAMAVDEEVSAKDQRWLERYEAAQEAETVVDEAMPAETAIESETSKAKIGEVSFAKLEQDLAIFDEEPHSEEPLDQ